MDEKFYELKEFDEKLVRMFIKKVMVHDAGFKVEFKSGRNIEAKI